MKRTKFIFTLSFLLFFIFSARAEDYYINTYTDCNFTDLISRIVFDDNGLVMDYYWKNKNLIHVDVTEFSTNRIVFSVASKKNRKEYSITKKKDEYTIKSSKTIKLLGILKKTKNMSTCLGITNKDNTLLYWEGENMIELTKDYFLCSIAGRNKFATREFCHDATYGDWGAAGKYVEMTEDCYKYEPYGTFSPATGGLVWANGCDISPTYIKKKVKKDTLPIVKYLNYLIWTIDNIDNMISTDEPFLFFF